MSLLTSVSGLVLFTRPNGVRPRPHCFEAEAQAVQYEAEARIFGLEAEAGARP